MANFLARLSRNRAGATAIEYGLIAALIAIACIGGMKALSTKLNTTFSNVSRNLPAA